MHPHNPGPPPQDGEPSGGAQRHRDEDTTQEAPRFARPPHPPRAAGAGHPGRGESPASPWSPVGGFDQRFAGGYGGPPADATAAWAPNHAPVTPPQPTTDNRPSTRRRWWLAGAAVVAVVAAGIAGAVVAVGGKGDDTAGGPTSTTAAQVPATPVTTLQSDPSSSTAPSPAPPAPPAPTVAVDALPALLLTAEQVGQHLDTPGMTSIPVESKPLAGNVSPANCTGVWGPAYAGTYDGSGFSGLAVQGVFRNPAVKVAQAVVAFPDSAAATAFFDKQSADWAACKSSHLTFSYDGQSNDVDVGVPAMAGDVMTIGLTSSNAAVAGQKCERDLTVRGNVIVDVRACSPTINSGGYDIATDIAARIQAG